MKKIKKILSITASLLLGVAVALGVISCSKQKTQYGVYDGDGNLVFDNKVKQIQVEYGEVYQLPMRFVVNGKEVFLDSMKLLDAEGVEQKTSYGAFTFNKGVGEYTVEYVGGGKTFTVKIVCKDTVAPVVRIVSYDYYGVVDEEISLPKAEFSDLAGIASIEYTLTTPSGKTSVITGETFTLEEKGSNVITITATDKNGVTGTQSITVQAMDVWVDENLRTGEIYTFDNETYVDLVLAMRSSTTANYSIVTEGYPEIAGEADDNGVLKIDGGEAWGNVNSLFFLHEDILANSGYEIVIKYAVTAYVDYVKFFNDSEEMTEQHLVEQAWGLQPGVWHELRINPIAYGYGKSVKDFVIQYRNRGNVDMYIDSIYFVQPEFEDDDWSETNLGDFDEEGYLHHVYQNVYNEPTTTRAYRVDGTNFSILSASDSSVPKANAANAVYPNLAPSGSVLKAVTEEAWGGLTYMFPEAFDLDKGAYIRMRIYLAGGINSMIFGALDGLGNDSTNTTWYATGLQYYRVNQWVDYILPAEALRSYSADGKISGFYLQLLPTGGLSSHEMTFYIDEIEAVYKSEMASEQQGINIATFENGNLYNLVDSDKNAVSVFEIAENALGSTGKSLKVTTGTNGGFQYLLDKPVTSDEMSNHDVSFKIGLPENANVSSVNISVLTALGYVRAVTSIDLAQVAKGEFVKFSLKGKDIASVLGGKDALGFEFSFSTSGTQTLYFDELGFIDYSSDTVAPTTTTKSFSLYTMADIPLELKKLSIEVSDNMDFAPTWEIVGLLDQDGEDVFEDEDEFKEFKQTGVFQPVGNSAYKLIVVLSDTIGNESQPIEITLNIEILEKADYYARALNFGNESALNIVDNQAKQIVSDDKAEDGKALSAKIAFGNGGEQQLEINLGGVYKVKDISKLVVKIRTAEAGPHYTWWRLLVNGFETYDRTNPSGSVSYYLGITANYSGGGLYPNGGSSGDITADYMTVTMTKDQILEYLTGIGEETGEETVLETLNIWTQWQPTEGRYTVLYIDSVEFEEYVPYDPRDLTFDTEKSANIITSSHSSAPTLVEEADGTKAVEFYVCNNEGSGRKDAVIDLGGLYTVGEVEAIKIRFKVVRGIEDIWYRIFINDSTTNCYVPFYGSFSGGVDQINKVMTEYQTITITKEGLLKYFGSEDVVLSSLTFAHEDFKYSPGGVTGFRIDSIEFTVAE